MSADMRTLLFLFSTIPVLVESIHWPKLYSHDHRYPIRKEHQQRGSKLNIGPALWPVIPVGFGVKAELYLIGQSICPTNQVERCSTDKCLNTTCDEIFEWNKTNCPTTPTELCQGAVTCACDHDKGYFLESKLTNECIYRDHPSCGKVPDCSQKKNSVPVCPDDCDEWTTRRIFTDRDIIYTYKCTKINAKNYKNCKSPLTCQCVFPYVRDDVTHKPGCVEYIDGLKMLCESVDDHRELCCEDDYYCDYNYCFKSPVYVDKSCPVTDKALHNCKKFGCQCIKNYAFKYGKYFEAHTAPINGTKYCIKREQCKPK